MSWRQTVTKYNRPLDQAKHGEFTVFIAGDDLEFRPLELDDQRVEVDQILRSAGYNPTLDYRLVELTFPGTKSWDDDEMICLGASVGRHFIAGKSDRLFTFAIDDIPYESPFQALSEPQLRILAGVKEGMTLALMLEGESSKDLNPGDVVSFEGPAVERLYSREAMVTVWLNNQGERKLPRGSYTFDKIVALLDIPAGYALSYVNASGKLIPLKEGDSLEIFDGIKFFSHAAGGAAA